VEKPHFYFLHSNRKVTPKVVLAGLHVDALRLREPPDPSHGVVALDEVVPGANGGLVGGRADLKEVGRVRVLAQSRANVGVGHERVSVPVRRKKDK